MYHFHQQKTHVYLNAFLTCFLGNLSEVVNNVTAQDQTDLKSYLKFSERPGDGQTDRQAER